MSTNYQKSKSPTREIAGQSFVRIPVKTHCIMPGEDFVEIAYKYCKDVVQPGDVIVLCQKALAISQGRMRAIDEVEPRPLADFISHQLTDLRYSQGVGSPELLEVAMQEVGPARVALAGAVQSVTRVLGRSGDFAVVAGEEVSLMRDFDPTLPAPHDRYVFLAPEHPEEVVERLGRRVGVQACIAAANDLGEVHVAAHTAGVDKKLVQQQLLDNPFGQGGNLTPIGIIRKVDSQANLSARR
ncbi:MAG: coenzyme F420-0:L-glutamate ligase [Bacillota bacterium]|nr:coenzyme F420-0:L-glutamate ligase [Bacillota bacterium]